MSSGYIPAALKRQLRVASDRRCSYCRSSELLTGIPLEIEHIIPRVRGGKTALSNLCLACHRCNEFKGDRIAAYDSVAAKIISIFNPQTQSWHEHFKWSPDGIEIIGITPCGRVTVTALQLNNEDVVAARHLWVAVGFHPPVL